MKYTFIGLGNMAQSMLHSLLRIQAILPEEVIVYSRTEASIENIRKVYPNIIEAKSVQEAAYQGDMIFVCVYTHFVIETLEKFYHENFEKPIVYISPSIPLEAIEEKFPRIKATMLIPSVSSQGGNGVTLYSSTKNVLSEHKEVFRSIFGRVGLVKEYYGKELFLATILSSCMPAFIARIIETFEKVGDDLKILEPEEIREIVSSTSVGVSNLLLSRERTPREIQEMVATKGGITEKGLQAMERPVSEMVDAIYRATLEKLGVFNVK